jgi:cystathionine beta-lyase/cystathionine gamma-synthase
MTETSIVVWFQIATSAPVVQRSAKLGAIVGTLLALINHGDALLAGQITFESSMKILLTYLVPYCVSTFAAVQAIREQM